MSFLNPARSQKKYLVILLNFAVIILILYKGISTPAHYFHDSQIHVKSSVVHHKNALNINLTKENRSINNTVCKCPSKILFFKNHKAASSTLAAILVQIATHYHNYEITYPAVLPFLQKQLSTQTHKVRHENPAIPKSLEYSGNMNGLQNSTYGYIIEHVRMNFKMMEKRFPRGQYCWVTTVREPLSQTYSRIKFSKLQNMYKGPGFDKIYAEQNANKFTKPSHMNIFKNEQSFFLFKDCSRSNNNFDLECTKKIYDNFDLVIPVDRFEEGILLLQKMLCFPTEDFAFIKNNVVSGTAPFKLSKNQEDFLMGNFKQTDSWFYNLSSEHFATKFNSMQKTYCISNNCETEIQQLREENRKLENLCGVKRIKEENRFTFDLQKLKDKPALILRCFSFVILPDHKKLLPHFNDLVKNSSKFSDSEIVQKLADRWWLELGNNKTQFY